MPPCMLMSVLIVNAKPLMDRLPCRRGHGRRGDGRIL